MLKSVFGQQGCCALTFALAMLSCIIDEFLFTLSGIAVQHADDGYSRRGNFGGSLVLNMVLIYSLDGTNGYGSRGENLRG